MVWVQSEYNRNSGRFLELELNSESRPESTELALTAPYSMRWQNLMQDRVVSQAREDPRDDDCNSDG
jgi:hypothetical protein